MLIAAFIIAIILIIVLDVAIVYDFLRYRYQHDRVPIILALFAIGTIATIIFTTTLLVQGAPGTSTSNPTTSLVAN